MMTQHLIIDDSKLDALELASVRNPLWSRPNLDKYSLKFVELYSDLHLFD